MTSEKMGTRTNLTMHHWNWHAWHGTGVAMVMAYGGSTNGAEWVEVGGHRMAKHGSSDKGRDVWTMGSLKGTGAVSGRIMLKGKIYTFTIPRGGVIYDINFFGGGKPTSKPTKKPGSKPSGAADSKDKYGQDGGGDQEGSSPESEGSNTPTDTSGTKGSDAATDIGDLPDASADDTSDHYGDHHWP
jgi:hypothetical protein